MKWIRCLLAPLFLAAMTVQAATETMTLAADADAGVQFPINIQTVTGQGSDGDTFLSVTADVFGAVESAINTTVADVQASFFEWSYNRGVGTIPNTCPAGYDANAGLCAEQCPAGFDSVAGVCWEQCPQGWSDGGALCTQWKWLPETRAKQSWVQPRIAMQCASGSVNEAGLCYEPCADTFTGVGPLCFGRFTNNDSAGRIRQQAAEQQADVLANLGESGIVVPEGQQPQLKTDMSFAPIVCGLEAVEGAFGLPVPDPVNIGGLAVDAAGDAIVNAISDSVSSGAWFVPSLAQTVVLDFSAQAGCEDDGVVAKASLNFKPSVTVKASTRMFDSVLHNMAGVDLGVMSVSVYELIPFRVYGTVGSTMSTDATLTSVVDRSLPPLMIDGKQHANSTALAVTPGMDLWLSAEAYLRVTSILSFIPDLLQLGAEFKVWVLELAMPYQLEEGLRNGTEGYEMYKQESLHSLLSSGRGYVDTFLRVFGIETNAFGDNADVQWDGYHEDKTLFDKEASRPVAF